MWRERFLSFHPVAGRSRSLSPLNTFTGRGKTKEKFWLYLMLHMEGRGRNDEESKNCVGFFLVSGRHLVILERELHRDQGREDAEICQIGRSCTQRWWLETGGSQTDGALKILADSNWENIFKVLTECQLLLHRLRQANHKMSPWWVLEGF